ncbi:MAG: transketolase [Bacteroidota bacterium]|nr:transketolase [Bacteroidota bacterium]MDX5506262.1 transketolase [Bacteroidota bacterium]
MGKVDTSKELTFEEFKATVLEDFKLAVISRETSLLGRREVLTGKAKFGIFGDGKEVAQIAWAKAFRNGDFRSGYYRDQTFMMAIGELDVRKFFASLYADTDHDHEPASAGRQMNGHFATQSLNPDGSWRSLTDQKNSSADISPTAGQMPRLLGLAQASKVYRSLPDLKDRTQFSRNGNEIAWGTIGNASTSEGLFFETINAAGVLQVPMVMSVWDDDYGISVHSRHQTTKENISEILKGFQRDEKNAGYEIITVKGWDYAGLVAAYEKAAKIAREEHVPVLIHVREMTQPQGHSTSGSHERYKNERRLKWEADFDCIKKMKEWILDNSYSNEEELEEIERSAKKFVREEKSAAWKDFISPIKEELNEVVSLINDLASSSSRSEEVKALANSLQNTMDPIRKDIHHHARKAIRMTRSESSEARTKLINWMESQGIINHDRYSSHLYSETEWSALKVAPVAAEYKEEKPVDARIVLRDNFDAILTKYPEALIFGEDSGKIGDVNQGLEGLQEKFGEVRVSDTGIREATILGQGIGMAMRGLRPIAEIQYLDYLLYALQIMSDDLATVRYRSKGRQKAPVIVRTRGHRLEGIWHSGSPMGAILNAIRGIYVCVPRNMTQAAGMYNTLLESDDAALIVECLNGYRLKENLPTNLGEFKVPLGKPEVIREGRHITLVTYGSSCRIAQEAADELSGMGIEVEIVDVQTLLPFDLDHQIVESLKKTNRVLFLDEDVPGGASAFMMQKVLEEQGGYRYLDSDPSTLTARAHRPAYGSDGDYFSKPSVDDVVEKVYAIMNEFDPDRFPAI